MKNLVEYIARALVDRPDAVELRVTPAEGAMLYELKVAPEDVGKVIGRDGRTINALRTVLHHAAQKNGEKARLELIDERRSTTTAAPTTP
ncbi:MAG: KH domain-containing protein [Archangium sp.]|nr:KH domain-containing protein [Archangium sp.]